MIDPFFLLPSRFVTQHVHLCNFNQMGCSVRVGILCTQRAILFSNRTKTLWNYGRQRLCAIPRIKMRMVSNLGFFQASQQKMRVDVYNIRKEIPEHLFHALIKSEKAAFCINTIILTHWRICRAGMMEFCSRYV